MKDKIVQSVVDKLNYRSEIGAIKYGTYLHENNFDNYLVHLQEELMDGCNYIEKIIQMRNEVIQLVNQYNNDQELGEQIRLKFTK